MNTVKNNASCCGCGMCKNVCPVSAIKLHRDRLGFVKAYIDESLCVQCGKCVSVCPVNGTEKELLYPQSAHIVQSKDDLIRRESTSGGAFSAFAKEIIERGGVVYGVELVGGEAVHTRSEHLEDLSRYRNSKYVQSNMSAILNSDGIEKDLKENRLVLFSGTPCQVNSILNRYSHYKTLYTVEVMCREVAAPLLLKKYYRYLESKYNAKVVDVKFRNKHYGYHYSVLYARFSNGKVYYRPLNSDPYLKAFFSDCFANDSCYCCPYRGLKRGADLTIWDAWKIDDCKQLINDDFGATKVLVNSQKGKELFDFAKGSLYCEDILPVDKIDDVSLLCEPLKRPINEKMMKNELILLKPKAFFDKYWPNTFMTHMRYFVKTFLYKTGIFQTIKGWKKI